MEEILLIVLAIILSPLAYIEYFIIIELKRKIGFLNFSLLIIVFIIFLSIAVQISSSFGGIIPIFGIGILVQFVSLYYLRKELKSDELFLILYKFFKRQ